MWKSYNISVLIMIIILNDDWVCTVSEDILIDVYWIRDQLG